MIRAAWRRFYRVQIQPRHDRGAFAPWCFDCRFLLQAKAAGEADTYWHDEPKWMLLESWRRAEPVQVAAARVEIDLNVRLPGSITFTGIEDVDGDIEVDDPVIVYESESGATGLGRITKIDEAKRVVYLAVQWSEIEFPDEPPAPVTLTVVHPGDQVILGTHSNGVSQTWTWDAEHGSRRIT